MVRSYEMEETSLVLLQKVNQLGRIGVGFVKRMEDDGVEERSGMFCSRVGESALDAKQAVFGT
jgi:hypothetical protein